MRFFGLRIERGRQAKATLGQILKGQGFPVWGEGVAWAPPNYGNYYATSVPAYRAIKLRADAVASASLKAYRRLASSESEPLDAAHPVQALLDRVNAWWTQSDLLKATETNLCIWGSAYWFAEKQGASVVGLWPLRPDRVRVIPDRSGAVGAWVAGFIYQTASGVRVPLAREEVVWFRYYNPLDEYAGLAPVAPARLTLDMGRNALKFNAAFFDNGAVPQDIIYPVQGPVTDEEIEDFYRRLEARYKNPSKAHRPMVVDLSVMGKPERLGLSQRDMEFLANLNFTVEDAARVWGVPPPKMYSQAQSTYNNVKQADQEFYTDTIANEWRFLEGEITEMLMPLLGEPEVYVRFDTSGILPLQEALAELHNRDRLDVAAGILTINEVRERRHLEPVAWGDQFWGPITLAPVGEFGGLAPPVSESIRGNGHAPLLLAKGFNALDRAGEAFGRRLDPQQRVFARFQREVFNAQREDVKRRLRLQALPLRKTGLERQLERQIGDLFDVAEWTVEMQVRGLPLIMRILVAAAIDHAADFGLGPFNSELASVRDWVSGRAAFWADRVNLETGRLLMAEMEEGVKLGEGIPELAQRVEKVFNFNDAIRAERIARTETLAASNAGHLEIYRQSGVVEEKMWFTAQDERVRLHHAEAHGQVVPLGAPFIVMGERLDAPGIGGSPENVINCRCTAVPVLRGRTRALLAWGGLVP